LQKSSKFFKKSGKKFKKIQNNSIFFSPFKAILASVLPFGFRKKKYFWKLVGLVPFEKGTNGTIGRAGKAGNGRDLNILFRHYSVIKVQSPGIREQAISLRRLRIQVSTVTKS
jgi:hypothetical protein